MNWSRETANSGTDDMSRYKVEYHEDVTNHHRAKHILVIDNPTKDDLEDVFICNAHNEVGVSQKKISIKGIIGISQLQIFPFERAQ